MKKICFFIASLWKDSKIAVEVFLIFCWCVAGFVIASSYDLLEIYFDFSRKHEGWNLDEWAVVAHILVIALAVFSYRRWMENRKIKKELLLKNSELEKSFSEIKTLQGIIPICASCKKIRDDKGYWTQVEEYIHDHTDAAFTHGVCPECQKKLYENYLKHREQAQLKVS